MEARQSCQRQGGDLATFKMPGEMEVLNYWAGRRPRTSFAFVGMHRRQSVLNMYR
jgi:hypothetical protein